MEPRKTAILIFTVFGLIQWLSWTPETCLMRHFLSIGTLFSFLLSVISLILSIQTLHQSGFLPIWGAYISYRYLSNDSLLNLRTSTADFLKNSFVVVLGAIGLCLIFVSLRILFMTDGYPKGLFTLSYFMVFATMLANYTFVPTVLEWTYDVPFSSRGTGVYISPILAYTELPNSSEWLLCKTNFVIIIDQRLAIFKPAHLMQKIELKLKTPVYEGNLSLLIEADTSRFPNRLSSAQMAQLEVLLTRTDSLIPFFESEIDKLAPMFSENIKSAYEGFGKSSMSLNNISTLKEAANQLITSMQHLDSKKITAIISVAVEKYILGDQKIDRTRPLFKVSLTTTDVVLKGEYAQMHNSMLKIFHDMAGDNYKMMLNMLPLLFNSSFGSNTDSFEKMQQMMSGSFTEVPHLNVGTIHSNQEDIDEAIRETLKRLRALDPDVNAQMAGQNLQNELRKKQLLGQNEEIDTILFMKIFSE
ncbi:hypothetical protein [Dyadobacter frigoris]|uniref:Uncharacterized protein n=1 Tax=Dyadobacter frigoris TaxID=2576211 RepID=A0A4U6CPF1_9BACT|nr:hypothetical protein [Dyadobacter frigoris]TKT85257.1 hypothetical protein FDK13_34255 [Dyadobacter frigoris]